MIHVTVVAHLEWFYVLQSQQEQSDQIEDVNMVLTMESHFSSDLLVEDESDVNVLQNHETQPVPIDNVEVLPSESHSSSELSQDDSDVSINLTMLL